MFLDLQGAFSDYVAVRNMAFNKKNDKGVNSIQKNNLSRPNNNNNNGNGVPIGNRYDGSSWSLSADEDYIVLCFGEDGAFDVVKDEKGVEDAEQVRDLNIHEKSPNADNQHDSTDQQDQDCINITPSKEIKEKEIVYTGRQQHRESNGRVWKVEGIEDCGMVSAESRDSDQSEGSRSSFAFPVLGWEWIGSPAQMPKSEGQHLKKQKARSVKFQCCRFL